MANRIDWNDIVLGHVQVRPRTEGAICGIYSNTVTQDILTAISSLEQRGYIQDTPDGWIATENGKARYLIDSQCQGW